MKVRFISSVLAAALALPVILPAQSVPLYAQQSAAQDETPLYSNDETITVAGGEGAAVLSAEQTAALAASDQITVSTTFTATATGVNAIFFAGNSTVQNNYITVYYIGSNKTLGVECMTAQGQYAYKGSVKLSDTDFSTPHKLTFVKDSTSFKIYLDGKAVVEGQAAGKVLPFEGVDYAGFGTGIRTNKKAYQQTGEQSNMEVYARALSESEIEAYYSGALGAIAAEFTNIGDAASMGETQKMSSVAPLRQMENGSITGRFKITGDTSKAVIASLNDADNTGNYLSLTVSLENGISKAAVESGTAGISSSADLPESINLFDGNWHTVTAVRNGNTYSFYADGEKTGETETENSGFFNLIKGADSFTAGYADKEEKDALAGSIDFVQVHSTALSNEETYILHNATKPTGKTVTDLSKAYKTDKDTIFYPGMDGSAAYRIPSLITTTSGTLIAGYDKRNDTVYDQGNIDMSIRRKEAGDTSWQPLQTIVDLPKNPQSGKAALLIDSVLVQDNDENSPHKGRVWMLMDMFPESYAMMEPNNQLASSGYITVQGEKYLKLNSDGNETYVMVENGDYGDVYKVEDGELGEKTAYTVVLKADAPYQLRGSLYKDGQYKGNIYMLETGKDKGELRVTKTSYLWLTYSDDDGKTWSNPVDINKQVKEDWMVFLGAGPGRGLQLENGRLMFSVYSANRSWYNSQSSYMIYSDDYGTTWTRGESPQTVRGVDPETMTSGGMLTEAQAVQLKNGDVMLFMRNTGGNSRVAYAVSKDGGKTWAKFGYLNGITEVYCQLSVISYTGSDGNEYILMSNPGGEGGTGRVNGKVRRFRVTSEGNLVLAGEKMIAAGEYGYSCLTQIADAEDGTKRFGLLYEGVGSQGEYVEFDERYFDAPEVPASAAAPAVTSAELETVNGNTWRITAIFDQPVFATTPSALNMQYGNNVIEIPYVSGSGTDTLIFEAPVSATLSGVVYVAGGTGTLENKDAVPVKNKKTFLADYTWISSGLSVTDFTSQMAGSGLAANAVDGNANTYWHSDYKNPDQVLPQSLTVKLASPASIDYIGYLPRQDVSNAIAKNVTIEASSDGVNFTTVRNTTLENTSYEQYIEIEPTSADTQYIRFTVNSTYFTGTGSFASIAELEFFMHDEASYTAADKSEINTLIENAMSLKEADYTAASWQALSQALTAAKDAAGKTLSKTLLSEKTTVLKEALKNLVPVAALQEIIDEANKLNSEDWEPAGWSNVETSLASATDLLTSATSARDALDAKMSLSYAISTLQKKKIYANKELLQKAYDDALAVNATQIQAASDAIRQLFESKKSDAKMLLDDEDAAQDAVDKAYEALVKAIAALPEKTDKTALEQLVADTLAMDLSIYTEKTVKTLTREIGKAQKVLEDVTSTQNDIDRALAKLQAAKEALERTKADTSALQVLYDKAVSAEIEEKLNSAQAENIENYHAKLAAAKAVLDMEYPQKDDVDTAYANLEEALTLLDRRAGKAPLENIIRIYSEIDTDLYTPETAEIFETALKEAMAVMEDPTVSQDTVDTVYVALLKAKAELELKAVVTDKTKLAESIEKAQAMENSLANANAQAVENFNSRLETAKAVFDNENADQSMINQAWMDLEEAMQMLMEKADMTVLEAAIEKVKAFNAKTLAEADQMLLAAALEKAEMIAKDMYASQSAVDAAAEHLENLLESLKALDYTLLQNMIDTAMEIDTEKLMPSQSLDTFKTELTNASALINTAKDQNAIRAQTAKLYSAYLALDKTPMEEEANPGDQSELKEQLASFIAKAEELAGKTEDEELKKQILQTAQMMQAELDKDMIDEEEANRLLALGKDLESSVSMAELPETPETPENPDQDTSKEPETDADKDKEQTETPSETDKDKEDTEKPETDKTGTDKSETGKDTPVKDDKKEETKEDTSKTAGKTAPAAGKTASGKTSSAKTGMETSAPFYAAFAAAAAGALALLRKRKK